MRGYVQMRRVILYSEMLTDFERIGDHILNIAQEMVSVRRHVDV